MYRYTLAAYNKDHRGEHIEEMDLVVYAQTVEQAFVKAMKMVVRAEMVVKRIEGLMPGTYTIDDIKK